MKRRRRNDEDGFAMIMAVILTALVATLAMLVLTSGTHTNFATGRGRSYTQALHVADAGIEETMIKFKASGGSFSGTFTGSANEGNFSVVVTKLSRSRYQVESTGTVNGGPGLSASRKIRVILAPPQSFKYALFSYTSVSTKNNDTISGDIWANQNIFVDQNDVIQGSATAATGSIWVDDGGIVTGDAWSGGYDPATTDGIHLENGSRIDGSAKASVTAPTDPVTCGGESSNNYTVRLQSGAVVGGNVTTWGTKSGPGVVAGTIATHICTAAPAAKPMPQFTYSATNYDPTMLHVFGTPSAPSATAIADFTNWFGANKTSLTGTIVIFQSGTLSQNPRVDLDGGIVTGDLTIVTNAPIYTASLTDADEVTDATVVLASTYQPPTGTVCEVNKDSSECSIHAKNDFQTTGDTAVLIYAPYGPVAIKNNAIHFGAIWADNIQIKNNQEITYDARIERVVGFGPVTLEVQSWMELEP
jgi:hypothetical protein